MYSITDIGILPGGKSTKASAINNHGEVAGTASTTASDAGAGQAFLWRGFYSGIQDLGLGLRYSGHDNAALGLNDVGLVVGEIQHGGQVCAFLLRRVVGGPHVVVASAPCEYPQCNDVIDGAAATATLCYLGAYQASLRAVNDQGRAVGWGNLGGPSPKEAIVADLSSAGDASSFNDAIESLPMPAGDAVSEARDVADGAQGAIVGWSSPNSPNERRAVVWSGGAAQALPSLGADWDHAEAINRKGVIAGYSRLPGSRHRHATCWTNNSVQDLGTLGGLASIALDINRHAVIVGSSQIATGKGISDRAVLWDPPTPLQFKGYGPQGVPVFGPSPNTEYKISDLNDLIPKNTGWVLTRATSINDHGQITGIGTKGGQPRAWRLSPVAAAGKRIANEVTRILFGVRDDGPGIGLGPTGPGPVPPWGGGREWLELTRDQRDLVLSLVLAQLAPHLSPGRAAHAIEDLVEEAASPKVGRATRRRKQGKTRRTRK